MKPHTRQHIVPQAYLKRFAQKGDGKRKKPIIYVRNKGQKNTFIKTVDEVAFVKNYYDISFREDEKYWEKHFAKYIEPLYGKVFDNIISKIMLVTDREEVLSPSDKKEFAKAISFQIIRTPDFLNRQVQNRDLITREVKEKIIADLGSNLTNKMLVYLNRVSVNETMAKDITFNAIAETERLERYSEILSDRKWLIYINNTDTPFYTSDNPVVMYNIELGTIGYTDNGIGRDDTFIYYPLTPKILLHLVPNSFLFKNLPCLSPVSDEQFVHNMNSFQERNAFHQIYSKQKFR